MAQCHKKQFAKQASKAVLQEVSSSLHMGSAAYSIDSISAVDLASVYKTWSISSSTMKQGIHTK